jgi:hypothetical protein
MGKFHSLSRIGVGKLDPVGPKGDLARVIQGGILPLTDQGEATAGELDTNLVGAACMKLDFDTA